MVVLESICKVIVESVIRAMGYLSKVNASPPITTFGIEPRTINYCMTWQFIHSPRYSLSKSLSNSILFPEPHLDKENKF